MRAQMSEVVVLTQLARKFHLMFRLLVPPSISVLVVIISIFILVLDLTIIFSLFLIPSRLLVSFLVRELHREYTHRLGRLRQSRGLSRCRLIN